METIHSYGSENTAVDSDSLCSRKIIKRLTDINQNESIR